MERDKLKIKWNKRKMVIDSIQINIKFGKRTKPKQEEDKQTLTKSK